jgi:hypothetical protein
MPRIVAFDIASELSSEKRRPNGTFETEILSNLSSVGKDRPAPRIGPGALGLAIRPIGPQVAANCPDQRSASPRFKQPIEYEYRFAEYRFAEYEYDEIRCEGTNIAI